MTQCDIVRTYDAHTTTRLGPAPRCSASTPWMMSGCHPTESPGSTCPTCTRRLSRTIHCTPPRPMPLAALSSRTLACSPALFSSLRPIDGLNVLEQTGCVRVSPVSCLAAAGRASGARSRACPLRQLPRRPRLRRTARRQTSPPTDHRGEQRDGGLELGLTCGRAVSARARARRRRPTWCAGTSSLNGRSIT